MTTTETDLAEFARAVSEYQRTHGANFPKAVRAIFPDWLVFTDCAEGSVDLVDAETPEWARDLFYNLPKSDRRDVERAAWEKIQKDRRENA